MVDETKKKRDKIRLLKLILYTDCAETMTWLVETGAGF